MKAGRKGNLNVATEVNKNETSLNKCNEFITIFIIFLNFLRIRYFKWHLLFIWLRFEKQREILWSSIRCTFLAYFDFFFFDFVCSYSYFTFPHINVSIQVILLMNRISLNSVWP